MASASVISRQRLLRAVRQTEIVCVQNLFDLADQRSRDVLMEMHGAEHRVRAFLPAGVAARCAEPDPREPGTALAARAGVSGLASSWCASDFLAGFRG